MAVSMSKSALLLSPCIRWAGEGAVWYKDEFANTEKRDMGILFHERMDLFLKTGSATLALADGIPDKVRNWLVLAIQWWDTFMKPRCTSFQSEVYVAYNFSTGLAHCDPEVTHRNYPDLPGMVPGTADVVGFLHDGSLWVGDWKTGKATGAREQLMSLALPLSHIYPNRPITIATLLVTDDGVLPQEEAISWDELCRHEGAMDFSISQLGGPPAPPVRGIHCTQLYCPHLAHCPGVAEVTTELAESSRDSLPTGELMRRYDLTEEPVGPEQSGYIMSMVTAAKRQVEYLEKRVKGYCENGGRCIAGQYEFSKRKDGFRWRPM